MQKTRTHVGAATPLTSGYALTQGVQEFDHRFTHEDLRKRAEECERLGRENSLPVLWAFLAPISSGLALIREGKAADGIAPLKAALAYWEASGGKGRSPTIKAFLAEAMALAGSLDYALLTIDEIIEQVERPGWEERLHFAEVLRLKGWMLSLKGDLEGAERNFSPRSTGHAARRRKCGSCARRPASHAYGRAKANARRPIGCLLRFMAGSQKVLIRRS